MAYFSKQKSRFKGLLVAKEQLSKRPDGVRCSLTSWQACVLLQFCYSRYMDETSALAALGALSQATRLQTFRLLVNREPDGVPAGELARLVGVPQNTLSTHLSILANASLVHGERHSRSIIYRADLSRLREVVLFLLKDCCGGRADLCGTLIADLSPCCTPKAPAHD